MTFADELKKVDNPALRKVADYLQERAKQDSLFASSLKKEQKSLNECWNYIVAEARKKAKNNCACLEDEEVYGIAVHYYDEDDLKANPINTIVKSSVSSSKTIEKDKKKPVKKVKKQNALDGQLSIFDF